MGEPTCARCSAPGAGVVSVAELDEDRTAGRPVAEVVLCADHLARVAEALGCARPAELRGGGHA